MMQPSSHYCVDVFAGVYVDLGILCGEAALNGQANMCCHSREVLLAHLLGWGTVNQMSRSLFTLLVLSCSCLTLNILEQITQLLCGTAVFLFLLVKLDNNLK